MNYLAASIILGFVHIGLASTASIQQRGLAWGAGPRDEQKPPLTGVGGRLERASKNFQETFPLFLGALLLVKMLGEANATTEQGEAVYFWARVVYLPLYALGIPYLRTLTFAVAVFGIALILKSAF